MKGKTTPQSGEDFEAILRFLPVFEAEGYEFGEWEQDKRPEPGIITMPYVSYSSECSEFLQALYEHGWIALDFKWCSWQRKAAQYWKKPELIEKARLETMRKLLTTHVRKERFCEGHLLAAFRNGQITAILRRVRAIHQSGKKVQPQEMTART